MFNSIRLFTVVALLLFLTAAPIMAADGSAKYSVSDAMVIAGNEIKPGEYDVKWQSHSPEATVVFKQKGKAVLTVEGKIETLSRKSDFNSMLVGKDASGRSVIKGLLFSGKNFKIVFE